MPPKPARLTHFLCIPLVTPTSSPQLQHSLSIFREKVTQISTPELPDGIPEKAIRPLGTLHLTLGVMSLLSQERVDSAVKQLRELDLRQLLRSSTNEATNSASQSMVKGKLDENEDTRPLYIALRGLSSMHPPAKTSVLYSPPVDEDGRLFAFGEKVRNAFIGAGLLELETRPLLLHATIINTVYVPGVGKGRGGHGKSRAKLTLDARELLEDYEDFVWMSDVKVEQVAIFRMSAQKGEDGEEIYIAEGEIEMP